MPKRGIDSILDVAQYLKQQGCTNESEITLPMLRGAVNRCIGLTDRTWRMYFHNMQSMGFLEKLGEGKFRFNFGKCEELLV